MKLPTALLQRKITWILVAIALTISFILIYIVVQQALRIGANEPQRSMVGDIAYQLQSGRRPDEVVNGRVDIATDMDPFIIIYDQYGKVVRGNGYLGGQVPQVPIGVLYAAKAGKSNTVTWQPDEKTRIASVSNKVDDYYVLGGRSLRVVEMQTSFVRRWLGLVWILCVVTLFGGYRLSNRKANAVSPVDPEA